MKKVLLGSTALLMSAGVAAADVAVSGDGRMGIIDADGDTGFTSRIRIAFSASGETDAGLSFGGGIRADNSIGGASGTAGSVFIEGAFGKITMGDVSGAAEAAVGDVSGVGLTGLGDFNEMTYLSNNTDVDDTDFDDNTFAAVRPVARYEYSFGDGTIYASIGNPGGNTPTGDDIESYAVGGDYTFGDFTIALGWETLSAGAFDADHAVGGISWAFGDATLKATYGDSSDLDLTQWMVSGDYVIGATTLTAYYSDVEIGALAVDADGFGLGAAYDLGGGASIKAGYADFGGDCDAMHTCRIGV